MQRVVHAVRKKAGVHKFLVWEVIKINAEKENEGVL